MTRFMSGDFILNSDSARDIYHSFAKDLPIVNYHSRFSAEEIYNNVHFENINQAIIRNDSNIWRLMRTNGIDERYISGDASDKEKFIAFAQTIERAIGNPLYHWAHMQLKTFFNISLIINEKNAEEIWEQANAQLGPDGLRARDILKKMNVKIIATNEQPFSELRYFRLLKEQDNDFMVVPTLKADDLINISFEELGKDFYQFTGKKIDNLYQYEKRIKKQMYYFHEYGCRSVDIAESEVFFEELSTNTMATFLKIINYEPISSTELKDFKTYLTHEILTIANELNWVFQIHYGIDANVNTTMVNKIGKNKGFDTFIEQNHTAKKGLFFMFDQMKIRKMLLKTVLYNLNPEKNMFALITSGAFQEKRDDTRGLIQPGPAWSFQNTLNQKRIWMESLAEQGVFMNFIGTTTDAKSLFTLIQHDYFRRILCNILGNWMELGLMPDDGEFVRKVIEDICYKNALVYFGFEVTDKLEYLLDGGT